MKKMTILNVRQSEYERQDMAAKCSHCGNCGGPTGCGAHCKGGKVTQKK